MNVAAVKLASIHRRFDAIAIEQLRTEASRLAAENETLREQLAFAEQAAQSWRDDALDFQLQLCKQSGSHPGITQTGSLVIVPPGATA